MHSQLLNQEQRAKNGARALRLILSPVFHRPPSSPPPVWARLAAWLGFLAVLSALLAPAALVAQELRTGKLGGICGVGALIDGSAQVGSGEAPHPGSHCDLCGAPGWLLPPQVVCAIPCFAGHQVASADFPVDSAVRPPGLPFSRGPPAL